MELNTFLVVTSALAALAVYTIYRSAVVVPQQNAYVIERLGRYSSSLSAGFHILVPFFDRIAYRHSLKEHAIDIPEQICITADNVQVGVDGVIYLQVLDPKLASYGIGNFVFAITQLAQTTLRSEMGKIDLDRTFEERAVINSSVVEEVDKASDAWGVKVLRYEIKNITPPTDVLQAMEKQMRAEREKRAVVLASEGERDAKINEAEGEAEAILAVARATGGGLRVVGEALQGAGGAEAMHLRIAEEYITEFGKLAKAGNTFVVPASLADISGMITLAKGLLPAGGPEVDRAGRA
jgi:regulator of protease activity HflC (stomatin/prohibitin superfamily)